MPPCFRSVPICLNNIEAVRFRSNGAPAPDFHQGRSNQGGTKIIPVETILKTLIEVAGLDVQLESDAERIRASEVPKVRADISKAHRDLGWIPEIGLRDTLEPVYAHALGRIGQ